MSNRTPIQLPLPVPGATIEIPLTKGYTTIVDAVDADLAQYKWCASENDGRVYAIRTVKPYIKRLGTILKLHRIILERMIGRTLARDEFVDHINGQPLDNRRSNLRAADNTKNQQNKKRRRDNQSGYKGVSHSFGKWEAVIRVNGVRLRLGRFGTPEEAHEAYKEAAVKYFGEFARFE